jgi:tetratricopeptide (TPR) repeat protein
MRATQVGLSELLNDHDAAPHAQLQLLLAGHREAAPQVLDRMLSADRAPLSALRTALSQAWLAKDAPRELELILHLLDRSGSEEDHAALALRGAQLAVQLEDLALGETLLDRALSIAPNHAVTLAAQAELYLCLDQWPRVAQALSAFAAASHVTSHRAEALHQAALIWLDRLGDGERGEAALEAAAHLAPNDDDLAERLQRHYLETEQRVKLLEQIERRLDHTSDADLKQRLVALRDRTLQEVGATPRPRPVAQKVDASPEHHDALDAYARRSFASGEIKAAEGAWLQLARIVPDPNKQADYYRSLAELYCKGDFNLARAAVCYSEVRKRLPNDLPTAEKLIGLYERLQRTAEAIELQNDLLRAARDDSERRRWTLRLAALHEARDPKQAELLLQQARKSWPYQADVLQALAQLHRKNGQTAALQGLLERATKEAKNELLGGSFELKPFDILRTCAEVAHDVDAAHVIRGTQVALGNVQDIVLGKDRLVTGMGAKASGPRVDKLLLPEALSPALLLLLEDAGHALDRATQQDLTALGTLPLAQRDESLAGYCQDVARSLGLRNVDFQVSPQLGTEIVAWSSSTPCLVLGQALVVSGDRPLLTHFLYRALKVVALRATALLRGTPADAQLRLCALLCALIPDWQPPGLDRSLVGSLSDRICSELPAEARERLEPLAQEIVSVFGARTAQVSVLIERWAQRSALLACGDMSVALRAVAALTSKETPLPDDPTARLRWVAKNPLARDLILFSVSDEYFAARRE